MNESEKQFSSTRAASITSGRENQILFSSVNKPMKTSIISSAARLRRLLSAGAFALGLAATALAQGTAFTWQGRLSDAGQPANGLYDLSFVLYDAGSGGTALGTNTIPAAAVTNGLFTTTLDFGAVFGGNSRWLEIAVRTNGSGVFTAMNPRQQVTPTPQALYATTAASADSVAAASIVGTVPLAQLPTALVTNNQSGVTLRGAFTGDGGGLTNLPAASLTGTLADSQLSTNIARLNIPNTATPATGGFVIFSGFIVGVGVTNGGSGYTAAPLVTVTDVSGSNAVITATVSNGVVVSLAIQNAGINYSAGTTLTIAPPPSNAYQTFSSRNIFNGANTFNNVSNTFTGSFTGNGGTLTNLNAAKLTGTAGNFSAGSITISSNLYLPATTATAGIIYSGGSPLIHCYGTGNFFAGSGAGNLTITGTGNTADGYRALTSDTSGNNNTANGNLALYSNTNGSANTASGCQALYLNKSGNNNTANGAYSLWSNTTGSDNVAVGPNALHDNTTGGQNVAVGSDALRYNSTGTFNTASGVAAMQNNTTGSGNTASGLWALIRNISGNANTAVGNYALGPNTTGNNNSAVGQHALRGNTTGDNNTAMGFESLASATNGSYNIGLGYQAGWNITSGSSNIAIGNMGLASDTNTIRIGSGQTQAFIAGQIIGDGSGLTNLNAAQVGSGTMADARLSSNVALLNGTNTFTGTSTVAGTLTATNASNVIAGTFTGSGAGLTNLSANAVTGGLTVNLAVLVPGGGTNILCFTNGILRAIQ